MTGRPEEGKKAPRAVDEATAAIQERCLQRLKELGWTQQRLADETGELYKNVNRWLGSGVKMPLGFLDLYVKAVPVNLRWLITGDGASDPQAIGEEGRPLDPRATIQIWFMILEFYTTHVDDAIAGMISHTRVVRETIQDGWKLLDKMPAARLGPELEWIRQHLGKSLPEPPPLKAPLGEEELARFRQFMNEVSPPGSESEDEETDDEKAG